MSGQVVANPKPGPHFCSPGVVNRPTTDPMLIKAGFTTYADIPSQYTHPAGTTRQCECGKTWISKPPRYDNWPGDVTWRREHWWERRHRTHQPSPPDPGKETS